MNGMMMTRTTLILHTFCHLSTRLTYITTAVRLSNIRNSCLFILDYMLLNENERNNDLWENEEEWQTTSWET